MRLSVDAIIFLAPISAFDQVLTEDRSINRLEDSVLLWKAVCSSKLLAGVDLILFLNKCDILERKLIPNPNFPIMSCPFVSSCHVSLHIASIFISLSDPLDQGTKLSFSFICLQNVKICTQLWGPAKRPRQCF
jgi:hypothetical protein